MKRKKVEFRQLGVLSDKQYQRPRGKRGDSNIDNDNGVMLGKNSNKKNKKNNKEPKGPTKTTLSKKITRQADPGDDDSDSDDNSDDDDITDDSDLEDLEAYMDYLQNASDIEVLGTEEEEEEEEDADAEVLKKRAEKGKGKLRVTKESKDDVNTAIDMTKFSITDPNPFAMSGNVTKRDLKNKGKGKGKGKVVQVVSGQEAVSSSDEELWEDEEMAGEDMMDADTESGSEDDDEDDSEDDDEFAYSYDDLDDSKDGSNSSDSELDQEFEWNDSDDQDSDDESLISPTNTNKRAHRTQVRSEKALYNAPKKPRSNTSSPIDSENDFISLQNPGNGSSSTQRPSNKLSTRDLSHLPRNIRRKILRADRQEKRARQTDREKQGVQNHENLRNMSVFSEISISLIRKSNRSIHEFVSDNLFDSLPLPPMPGPVRKIMQLIASEYGCKSKTKGSGKRKMMVVVRTNRSKIPKDWNTQLVDRVVNTVFKKRHWTSNGKATIKEFGNKGNKNGKRKSNSNSNNNKTPVSAAQPKTGSVVGGDAKPIGDSNIGHKMLLSMGWKPGDALGAEENKGRTAPVEVVVRKKNAGLGF